MTASESILFTAPRSILELVPHRPPMVFVDALEAADVERALCSFRVTEQNPCLRAGRLPAIYAVEAMAQAAAAHLGALALWRNEPPAGGYLVGVRDLVLGCPSFAPGDALEIAVRRTFGSDRFASYGCVVRTAQIDAAKATVNVLRRPA